MKKWFVPLLILAICALFCGCEGGVIPLKSVSAEELKLTFDVPAEIQVGETSYPCRISHDVTQKTQITLGGDGALDGLQFCRTGETTTLHYQSMAYEVREAGFSDHSSFFEIAKILDCAQSYVNLQSVGDNTFTGSVDDCDFQIKAEKDGTIQSITTDSLQVTFLPESAEQPTVSQAA